MAPAALAGYALSSLVPGPVLPIVHAGPVLVVLVTVGFATVRLALIKGDTALSRMPRASC
ncbi:hypothetical protein [Nonomuraea sp. B5E05]|uniref:hypothetical protein n=1 Tax=Nonomuraea sp. B5E05 TaxID=3153569 RepID=UPI0032608571